MMEIKKLYDTDLLLTKKYLYKTCIYCCYFPIFLYSGGLCPQGGYVRRGFCPQGVMSAGGFVRRGFCPRFNCYIVGGAVHQLNGCL